MGARGVASPVHDGREETVHQLEGAAGCVACLRAGRRAAAGKGAAGGNGQHGDEGCHEEDGLEGGGHAGVDSAHLPFGRKAWFPAEDHAHAGS
eukprot:6720710-Prymnesium_polylepis.1